jgi:WD40-like Beta Propeller Repeat
LKEKAISATARWSLPLLGAAVAALLLLPSSAAAVCANDPVRATQVSSELPEGTLGFPDCMALEMVSPAKKSLQQAFAPLFSRGGERVLFNSLAALAGTPGMQNGVGGDPYVASRGVGGWGTEATSPPTEAEIVFGGGTLGGPYAFAPELERWLLFGATQAQNEVAALRFFRGGLDGSFLPISELLVPEDESGTPSLRTIVGNARWRGTARDLGTTLFNTSSTTNVSTTFLPGDPGEGTAVASIPGGDRNEYVISRDAGGNPTVELLARDKDGVVHGGFCGTHVGGGIGGGANGRLDQGAISADGSRIYFTTRPDQPGKTGEVWPTCDTDNPLRIMVRTTTPDGPTIEELIAGEADEPDDLYQGASADGSKVFFTTTRDLASSDLDTGTGCGADPGNSDGCDLYLFDEDLPPGDRLIQVSAGNPGTPTPGEGGNVLSSITALANDGSHAYFVAEGVLAANANPEGETAVGDEPNLYAYEEGTLTFVGILDPADEGSLWGKERSFAGNAYAVPLWEGPEEGGDGHVLLFASKASLTDTDIDGGKRDVFRYDSDAETLQCVSCAALGLAADVFLGPYSGERPAPTITEPGRWASEDGDTVAFATEEPLAADDTDDALNPYMWAEGQLVRLPGAMKEVSEQLLPSVSASGNAVGFATESALLWSDGDTARDVYVARSEGGFMPPPPPPICQPQLGNCQGPAGAAPGSTPIITTLTGPGNPKAKQAKKKSKKQKKGKGKNKGKGKQKRQNGQGRNGK